MLLVDGYNVSHKFSDHMRATHPKHPMATAESLEARREVLQEALTAYSQHRGIKVVIAYDAIYRPNPNPQFVDVRTTTRSASLPCVKLQQLRRISASRRLGSLTSQCPVG